MLGIAVALLVLYFLPLCFVVVTFGAPLSEWHVCGNSHYKNSSGVSVYQRPHSKGENRTVGHVTSTKVFQEKNNNY